MSCFYYFKVAKTDKTNCADSCRWGVWIISERLILFQQPLFFVLRALIDSKIVSVQGQDKSTSKHREFSTLRSGLFSSNLNQITKLIEPLIMPAASLWSEMSGSRT